VKAILRLLASTSSKISLTSSAPVPTLVPKVTKTGKPVKSASTLVVLIVIFLLLAHVPSHGVGAKVVVEDEVVVDDVLVDFVIDVLVD